MRNYLIVHFLKEKNTLLFTVTMCFFEKMKNLFSYTIRIINMVRVLLRVFLRKLGYDAK